MDLGQDGEAVVGQALDDVGLPQRVAPVERAADDAGDQLAELLVAARAAAPRCGGRGSRGRSRGPRSRTGGRGRTGTSPQAPPQRLEQVQAPLELRPPRGRAARSPARPGGAKTERLDTCPNCDVGLHVQERGVQTGELLHRCRASRRSAGRARPNGPAATVLRRGGAGEGARAEVLRRRGRVRARAGAGVRGLVDPGLPARGRRLAGRLRHLRPGRRPDRRHPQPGRRARRRWPTSAGTGAW